MPLSTHARVRRRYDLRGQVQGVGFRPFIYRLATESQLAGYVANNSNGAVVEIEGPASAVAAFESGLIERLPPLARISELRRREIDTRGEMGFRIERSERDAGERPEVTPDAATCDDCLAELLDPADRRFRYPFANCTNCGPRYSIIRTVPYDRPATTMAEFRMCEPCHREYSDPADRRFHAQPNACPVCGPELRMRRADRRTIHGDPVVQAAQLLNAGEVVAVKGIGGYHLACRADRDDIVNRLRERKLRDGKPLAMMVPNIESAHRLCRLTVGDLEALGSPAAPIVLAPKNEHHGIAPSVAPGCRDFGIMLPYAPLHHLLFGEGLGPLVMTSANLSGQPLTYQDDDAFLTLGDVADAFLTHNRRIFRPIDDSVVYTFRGELVPVRRARGYAPRPLRLGAPAAGEPILALGGELKSSVCLYTGGEAIVSEHLGDLTNPEAYRHFVRAVERLKVLFEFSPGVVAHDLHPQYLSTVWARRLGLPTVAVQHHHAHILSVMAEWGEPGPVIGIACDGAGYGTDGAVWGCEVLLCRRAEFERLGHLEYFPLVGGDAGAIQTWRPAAALLRQALGVSWPETMRALERTRDSAWAALSQDARSWLHVALSQFDRQVEAGLNAPACSSLGRVFDAVSFLAGLCAENRHEAEAAMALEAAAGETQAEPYPFELSSSGTRIAMSLTPAVAEIATDTLAGETPGRIAARFHETVARMLAKSAVVACKTAGVEKVGLSGGCFANRRLLTRLVELLEESRLSVLYHRQVPAGDGGIALGQAWAAAWRVAAGQVTAARKR